MLLKDLIASAPGPLKIGHKELRQVVAQSSSGEFISFAQYIKKSQFGSVLAMAMDVPTQSIFTRKLGIAMDVPTESIPRIDQLSQAQLIVHLLSCQTGGILGLAIVRRSPHCYCISA